MAEITLAATVENIAAATDFVTEQLEILGCPVKTQMQFRWTSFLATSLIMLIPLAAGQQPYRCIPARRHAKSS